jgi:hypothetical protein
MTAMLPGTESCAPEPSPSSGRRLACFALGLLVIAAGIEGFVRHYSALFASASHRALAKAAMLDQHPRVDLLFLGTSRTQDGVSPNLVTRALREIAPGLGELHGFNAAFTGSSLEALTSLANRFSQRVDLKLLVIELSVPQLLNQPAPWEVQEKPPATLEEKLAVLLSASRTVKYRSAFVSDNLGRLPALLLFGSKLSGWETKGNDQIAAWLGKAEKPAVGFDAALWSPRLFLPGAAMQKLDAENDILATKISGIANLYRVRGVRVAFMVPPLTRSFSPAPERDALEPLFSEIARRSRCEVWDYARLDLPVRFYGNPSHLQREGRAHFSRALAIRVAEALKTN